MESNRDEALKCLAIAKSSFDIGDYSKALRFTEKSIRLYPTPQADQLIVLIKQKSTTESVKTQSKPIPQPTTTPTKPVTPEPAQERKYTTEQLHAVKNILACGKDYYKVLSVEKSATDAEIKKAYRKQALQFHPDKNSAPGADEAFKLVAKAFDVLSDSNKRAIHDAGGDAEMNRARSSGFQQPHFHHQYAYSRRHGEEISPEDLFNIFFGGGMRNNFGHSFRTQQQQRYRQQQRHRQQQRQQREEASSYSGISQSMPVILLILFGIFTLLFLFEGDPLYTFHPSAPYTNLRHTRSNHVKYYVNPKVFDKQIRNNKYKFRKTESQIESEWLSELKTACQSEQRLRENLLAQADGLFFGVIGRDEKAFKKAKNMKLEKCGELKKLTQRMRS